MFLIKLTWTIQPLHDFFMNLLHTTAIHLPKLIIPWEFLTPVNNYELSDAIINMS